MKKVLITLALVALLVLYPAAPLLAAEEGGGSAGTGGEVENMAPVIEEASLVVQIVDGEGIAWGWSASGAPNPGDRTMPYILKGENLHFELEVTDANGEADLTAMLVKMNLTTDIFFTGTLVSTTIDPDAGISKGLSSGDLVIDDSIAPGKYDITIDVSDAGGATDACDPVIYEPGVDIMRPEVSLVISTSTINFQRSNPGDTGMMANENPIHLTPQAVIGTEHIPVVFDLGHSGSDMVNGENFIPVTSIVWSTTPEISDNSMSKTKLTIASGVAEGTIVDVYYWLNVPMPQAEGSYSGSIDFYFVAD
jgi:hypothetical protein